MRLWKHLSALVFVAALGCGVARGEDPGRLLDALASAERQSPREAFEPRAVLDLCEKEPTRIFRWVRDQTRLVPYLGVLRGERGLLMDRSGNSLDRALLLGKLLREAGFEARLAHAVLSEEQAGRLMSGLEASARRELAWRGELAREAEAQADRRLPEALAALGALDAEAVGQFQRQALAEHYWVQWKHGEEWVDLDPSGAGAKPGQALAPAAETPGFEQLRPELYQGVRIDVIATFEGGGRRIEKALLGSTLRVADVSGERVVFRMLPLRLPDGFEPLVDAQAAREEYARHAEWLPTLQVGDSLFYQAALTTDGRVNERLAAEELRAVEPAGLAGLGSKIGKRPPPSGAWSEPLGELTALRLEYRIQAPGVSRPPILRPLFDGAGPGAQDRAEALLGPVELLILGGRLAPELVESRAARLLLDNRDAFLRWKRGDPALDAGAELGKRLRLAELPGPLQALALARQDDAAYLGTPNILSMSMSPRGSLDIIEGQALSLVGIEASARRGLADAWLVARLGGAARSATDAELIEGARKAGMPLVLGRLAVPDPPPSVPLSEPAAALRPALLAGGLLACRSAVGCGLPALATALSAAGPEDGLNGLLLGLTR